MGLDPAADADITILNGDFADDSIWAFGINWSWLPNFARYFYTGAPGGGLIQTGLTNIPGNTYKVELTITNHFFVNPFNGIWFTLGDVTSPVFFQNGTFQTILTPYSYGPIQIRFDGHQVNVGEHADIDNITITPLGDYVVTQLGFGVNGPHKKEVWPAVAADNMQLIASYKDKSSCLFLINNP